MDLPSIGHSPASHHGISERHDPAHAAEASGRGRKAQRASAESSSESTQPVNTERAHGVLSKLDAGHFRGVAAVRLAMKFHAELSARQSAAAGAELGDAVSKLQDGVAAVTAETDGASAAQAGFDRAVQATQAALSDGTVDLAGAVDSIRTALDDLLAAVADDAQPDLAAGSETDDDADTVAAPADDSLRAALTELFDDFVASTESITAVSMPEFTPPNGNGVAFDKFVAMYREMTGSVNDEPSTHDDSPANEASAEVDELV